MTVIHPSFDDVTSRLEAGEAVLLRATLIADLETPVGAYLKLREAFLGPSFLLESVEGGAVRGRYSMIGLDPDLLWRCHEGQAAISHLNDAPLGSVFTPETRAPLESLRALVAQSRLELSDDAPPMAAGIYGYLGYDMVRLMERLPKPNQDVLDLPDAVLMRPRLMVVFDAVKDELSLITPLRPQHGASSKALYEQGVERLEKALFAFEKPVPHHALTPSDTANLAIPEVVSNTSPEDYKRMVLQAKEYIKAGDIFQVVLSQRFDADFDLPPFALYRALRRVNPAPFLCYLDFVDYQIVCSSPEILVRMRDGKVTIRPIAGTRPRGATPAADQALSDELLNDPKERAEHLMLLDLGRNDVGRVAKIGSVNVTGSFFIEYYSHVMHIVSQVEGRLRDDCDALNALIAGFPAGTVSGAPKIRAMEIIDELEKHKRGVYAGCIGYFGANGEMDTCIVLRTAVLKNGKMHVQAGAGIVYDSIPESEQQECINKSRALFKAAEEAVRFASIAKRGQ
jgi:anthranilate synthase component 1